MFSLNKWTIHGVSHRQIPQIVCLQRVTVSQFTFHMVAFHSCLIFCSQTIEMKSSKALPVMAMQHMTTVTPSGQSQIPQCSE